MEKNLPKLLLICGFLGAGYYAFSRYIANSEKLPVLSLDRTLKIAQEIKHQMMIVTVKFVEGIQDKISGTNKQAHSDELIGYFTTKMADMYHQKEKLILEKYGLDEQEYRAALDKYHADHRLSRITQEIIEAMEKSTRGEMPNLEVDKKAASAYGKLQIRKIYEEMCKDVLVALAAKLKEVKTSNPDFNASDTSQFIVAVRSLNVFDRKIEFLKQKGFREEWGCPNEIFFKLTEAYKIKDAQFRQQITRISQIYDQLVEIIGADPLSFQVSAINNYFLQKDNSKANQKALSKSAIEGGKDQEEEITIMLNKSSRSETLQQSVIKVPTQLEDFPDEAFQFSSFPVHQSRQKK